MIVYECLRIIYGLWRNLWSWYGYFEISNCSILNFIDRVTDSVSLFIQELFVTKTMRMRIMMMMTIRWQDIKRLVIELTPIKSVSYKIYNPLNLRSRMKVVYCLFRQRHETKGCIDFTLIVNKIKRMCERFEF